MLRPHSTQLLQADTCTMHPKATTSMMHPRAQPAQPAGRIEHTATPFSTSLAASAGEMQHAGVYAQMGNHKVCRCVQLLLACPPHTRVR
jgi:hypothetical protein